MYYAAMALVIFIFLWRMVAGFKKGMVREIISLVSMIVAGVCLVLILTAIGSYMNEQLGKLIQVIIILLAVCFIYKIVSVLFSSLKLISELPVVKGVNAVLGAGVGAIEAVVIILILVQLLKYFSRI